MELADNFVQFSVTLLGFCLSGMRYLKGRKQAYFLLTCFYCTFGDILSNLLWCGMMIAVSYYAIRGLAYARTQTGAARQLRYFHIGVLCYVAAEYILWTSGCFRQGDLASFLYYGFDVLLTGCVFALLPATGRAVQA